jgi:methylglyoxal synthase
MRHIRRYTPLKQTTLSDNDLMETKQHLRKLRFGLAANRLHHASANSACFDWLRVSASGIESLNIELHTVGRTYDAIQREGLLSAYPGLIRYPYGREGGLMKLVARVTEDSHDGAALDGAIYLIDPVDPSSIFPEALALKRQCITHGRPFISTMAGAIEWIEVERVHAGMQADARVDYLFELESQCLALIAHDALKDKMIAFAQQNFDLMSRFDRRVATGTTGQRLNELARSKGWSADRPWVDRYLSGPMGGDAQIADLVLDKRCHKVIFFEDPHVARQHEADIQLLERAVRVVTRDATCATSPSVAQRWAQAVSLRSRK